MDISWNLPVPSEEGQPAAVCRPVPPRADARGAPGLAKTCSFPSPTRRTASVFFLTPCKGPLATGAPRGQQTSAAAAAAAC